MHLSSISQKSCLADPQTIYFLNRQASARSERVRFTGSGKWPARPSNIWKTPFWKQLVIVRPDHSTFVIYYCYLFICKTIFTIWHVGLIPIQLFGPIQAANKRCSSAKRPVKRGTWRSAISSTYDLLSKNQLTEFVFYCSFHFARLGAHTPLENCNL